MTCLRSHSASLADLSPGLQTPAFFQCMEKSRRRHRTSPLRTHVGTATDRALLNSTCPHTPSNWPLCAPLRRREGKGPPRFPYPPRSRSKTVLGQDPRPRLAVEHAACWSLLLARLCEQDAGAHREAACRERHSTAGPSPPDIPGIPRKPLPHQEDASPRGKPAPEPEAWRKEAGRSAAAPLQNKGNVEMQMSPG